jgi:hypothetical protein
MMLKMLPNMALRPLGWRFVWTVYFKSTIKTENIEEAFEDGMNKKVAKNDDVEYAAKHGIKKTWVEICVYVENRDKTEHFVTAFSTSTRISTSIFPTPCLEASSTSSV